MIDDDGEHVVAGDWITFSYGIPPVLVDARVSEKRPLDWPLSNGYLVFTVLGRHRPREGRLSTLRRHVGSWYKSSGPRAALKGQTDE